ncbi:MAG: extracellular solute-binding protein [Opitutus sp.]
MTSFPFPLPRRALVSALAVFALLAFAGCGKKTVESATAGGMEADLAATVKAQPEFYRTAPVSAIPPDLKWENGANLPEFADPAAKQGGTFRYYIADFPRTLRTIGPDATGGIRQYLLDYVAAGYIQRHPNVAGAVYPGLAKEWATDAKTKTVYFRLDPDARWSDGKPVTTDDVVFSFYFMRSPKLKEPWYNDFYGKTYTSVTVFDARTFAITLTEWKPDAIMRAGEIAPYARHAFQDFGDDWLERFQWRTLPTTGAYELLEKNIEKGRAVTLTKVPNWWAREKRFWRGRFNPDRYRFEVIRDPEKAFEAFARGDIDMLSLTAPKLWYEQMPETHPEVAKGYIIRAKFFNRIPRPDIGLWLNRAKLDNLDVRLGIHHATNWELVCSQYFRGDAVVMQTRSDGYSWRMHPTIKARAFDPTKARELFARAGYTEQGPDGILRKPGGGSRLSFTITSYLKRYTDVLTILQQEALKAGLEFKIEMLDDTTGWKKVQEKNHEIAFVAISRSVELYPRYWEMYAGSNAYEDAYVGKNGGFVDRFDLGTANPKPVKTRVQTNNMTQTFIPELDRLIELYDKAESMDEIKTMAAQMEQIIYDDAGWVNGFALPFWRLGYWRYVKWPAGFNVADSRSADEFFVQWIDEDEKKAVEEARKTGKTFPAETKIYDQFKAN